MSSEGEGLQPWKAVWEISLDYRKWVKCHVYGCLVSWVEEKLHCALHEDTTGYIPAKNDQIRTNFVINEERKIS